jgi:hypothetical protein
VTTSASLLICPMSCSGVHIASSVDGVLETVEQVAAMWDELRRLTPDMADREFAPCPGHYERAAYCQ